MNPGMIDIACMEN